MGCLHVPEQLRRPLLKVARALEQGGIMPTSCYQRM